MDGKDLKEWFAERLKEHETDPEYILNLMRLGFGEILWHDNYPNYDKTARSIAKKLGMSESYLHKLSVSEERDIKLSTIIKWSLKSGYIPELKFKKIKRRINEEEKD